MGYYDEHTKIRTSVKKSRFPKTIISSVIGGCVGALITLFVISPTIPIDSSQNIQSQSMDQAVPASINTVSFNVETSITQAIEKASGSVVGVINIQNNRMLEPDKEAGTGSGVIYKKVNNKAYVVTNAHVVNGANKIEISLADGTRVDGTLKGQDIFMDLAVVEIDGSHVNEVATFASSETIKLGEPVIAIGNPLGLKFSGSVTQGIISGLDRLIPIDIDQNGVVDWEADVIQTDAAINPGNSGGALINVNGDVIGINSMKVNQTSVEGIGFSIPISIAKPIIESLEVHGMVKRPFLGVVSGSLSDIASYHWKNTFRLPDEVTEGLYIEGVASGSPAQKAGLQEMDVITEFDGQKIKSVVELRKYLYQKKKVGETLAVTYYRNGEKQQTKLTLIETPGK